MSTSRTTIASDTQIQELANTIALQADALASGKVDASALFAHVRRIADNADTLKAWTADREHTPPTTSRRMAEQAVVKVGTNNALARSNALLAIMQAEDVLKEGTK